VAVSKRRKRRKVEEEMKNWISLSASRSCRSGGKLIKFKNEES
jgi:hypothetical protein